MNSTIINQRRAQAMAWEAYEGSGDFDESGFLKVKLHISCKATGLSYKQSTMQKLTVAQQITAKNSQQIFLPLFRF